MFARKMGKSIPRLSRLDVRGRRVLLRADLDVPQSPQGAVLDDTALRELLPTLRGLLGERAKVVVAADYAGQQSPEGVAARLGELLGSNVAVLGPHFEKDVRLLEEGQIALTPGLASVMPPAGADASATAKQAAWTARVAAAFDVYVLDGLRAARNNDPLVSDVPRRLASRGVGPLVGTALDAQRELLEAPVAPYALVVGGASLPRLRPVLTALLPHCTDVLFGGAVANTLLAAQGWRPGGSLYEPDALNDAVEFLRVARTTSVNLHFPIDAVIRTRGPLGVAPTYDVRRLDRPLAPEEAAIDVAIETCNAYREVLCRCVTAVWVGVMGDCFVEESQSGSLRVGRAVGEARRSFVAGDDTVPASYFFALDGRLRVVPGGDAGLGLLAGMPFPGLEALSS
jgi:phosphoglycerate kinase